MNIKDFQKKIDIIESKLDKSQLTDAFRLISVLMDETGIMSFKEKVNQLKLTYRYMLHYFAEGMADDSRETMFRDIVNSLRDIMQSLIIEKKLADSPDLFYSTSRICRHRNISFANHIDKIDDVSSNIALGEAAEVDTRELRAEKDNMMRELFDLLWTSLINKETAIEIRNRVLSLKDETFAAYIIAALTLSLLTVYDKNKLNILLDVYENSESDILSARSLVGIVLTLDKYKDRIEEDLSLKARMELWNDSILTYSRLRTVIKELIKARDTDRLTAKMRDEVIPELMKLKPDIIKKMRESSLDPDRMTLENNPEWEEILEKNGVADKLREFTEMQMEGADLMMVSFANLKGFPFFRNVNSWFLPFSADHPALNTEISGIKSLKTMVEMNKLMCDSDKYSLFLAFATLPEQQRNMMFGQFEAQMSQMMEDVKDKMAKESHSEFNSEAVVFIRDLYRFFKLFNKKNEFKDPFDHPLNFMALPYLNSMLKDEEMLTIVGEFYFKRGYYPEALAILSLLEKSQGLHPEYWEKIGFINQQTGNYQEALMAYQKSELLGNSGLWLIRNMAHVNTKIGNYRGAAGYYDMALEKEPENITFLMNAGYCLTQSGDYPGAVKYYYHANYLSPDSVKIWRAIAWAELMNGNLEKSEKFYDKILNSEPTVTDYLNVGHLKLVEGKVKEAINSYKKAYNDNEKEFLSAYSADEEVLKKMGVDDFTYRLVTDAIKINDLND